MQTAEVGTYSLAIYKNNAGLWEFWIKQNGHLLVHSTGTGDCDETKLQVQKHPFDIVMTKKEKKRFDPTRALEWENLLQLVGGPEIAG